MAAVCVQAIRTVSAPSISSFGAATFVLNATNDEEIEQADAA
jgi:hypothetical protein